MTDAERKALIEAGTHEYALQAIAQRLSRHLGRIVDMADVVAAVKEKERELLEESTDATGIGCPDKRMG